MRLIAVIAFAGFNGACYLMGAPHIFRLGLIPGIFCFWLFIRGPHVLFTLDEEAIAWSYNLKRKPLTRVLLADIREVYIVDSRDAEISNGLAVIDQNGVAHRVGTTGSPGVDRVWQELQRLCPTAKFGHCRDGTTIGLPGAWEGLKDVFG